MSYYDRERNMAESLRKMYPKGTRVECLSMMDPFAPVPSGTRGGFEDARGTLFFEIARIAEVKQPKYLLLENVPGLLNHDSGRTFATILSALDELGYDVTWQVLNSKDFGVPQARRRVYIVGYHREKCAGKILTFTQTSEKNLVQLKSGSQGKRLYSSDGISITLTSEAGGFGGKTGIYLIEDFGLKIKVKTKTGYQIAYPGDTIDTAYAILNSRHGRVGIDLASCGAAESTKAPDSTNATESISEWW